VKPLGMPAYGHLPHLPGSQTGPGDHTAEPGQAAICTVAARHGDHVSVRIKLDGSCVAVARINGVAVPLIRAGYLATASPRRQHHLFAEWADENRGRFLDLLRDGERVVGEWLIQAHGTRYDLPHEPFAAFDILRAQEKRPKLQERASFDELLDRIGDRFVTPEVLWVGDEPCPPAARAYSIDDADEDLALKRRAHGVIGVHEGAVWRVEPKGKGAFLAKWVRPGHKPGQFLERETGKGPVWNTWPRSEWRAVA